VYPAIAVLQALRDAQAANSSDATSEAKVMWVGSVGGMEADLVQRAGIPYDAIPAAGVHGVGLRALPGNLMKLADGYKQAKRILGAYKPDVLFFTGGYVAVPMALAGRAVPSVLYVPDIEPGLALKLLARFSDRIALTAPDSRTYFSTHRGLEVTGYPVRPDLGEYEPDVARGVFGLSPDMPVLLVFGGSKGARSINRALLAVLPQLLESMQVLHISGQLDWPHVKEAQEKLVSGDGFPIGLADRYHAYPYLHAEMGAAFAATDLVLARGGASTLGEFPHYGLPAILVPYPHAWRYQFVNASYLERHGAAVILKDEALTDRLYETVKTLMDDAARRERMSQAMRSLDQPQAASSISSIIKNLVFAAGQEGTQ
jgi:UDP-N-acetylglucosamine--N-acetylmuramyl-(pentapeptide) pyrophosphoryl-undecaprenol N-acetylglucosamine transferase